MIVRLDKSDADFVDVIHTSDQKILDYVGIGMFMPVGHADFYPNGGNVQPGCEMSVSQVNPACSHLASHILFTDTIKNNCLYNAYPCESMEEYEKGNCLKCGPKGCNRMGYWASPSRDINTLYLDTQNINHLNKCTQKYQVSLQSGDINSKKRAKGLFMINFHTHNETSKTKILDDSETVFQSNSHETKLISLDKHLMSEYIVGATITYKMAWDFLDYDSDWKFKNIEVFSAEHQKTVKMCPRETLKRFTFSKSTKYELC